MCEICWISSLFQLRFFRCEVIVFEPAVHIVTESPLVFVVYSLVMSLFETRDIAFSKKIVMFYHFRKNK